jgi:hypothetical protein
MQLTTNSDSNSEEFIPHLVICHLHREKVDLNRERKEATEGNPKAQEVFATYHGYIYDAVKESVDRFGFAHVFDFHGQAHRPIPELGYLLDDIDLALTDEKLNDNMDELLPLSSLQGIAAYRKKMNLSSIKFSELIRGKHSLGGLLLSGGFVTTPSPYDPSPRGKYFCGGYTTWHYSHLLDETRVRRPRPPPHPRKHNPGSDSWEFYVSATQIEPPKVLRTDVCVRDCFAQQFANAILQYVQHHYDVIFE